MTAARRILASSPRLDPEERLDLLVHALAQLPDHVRLSISGDGPSRSRLETLAYAYGIEDRLTIGTEPLDPRSGRVVYPSLRNAGVALTRPEDCPEPPLLLDPAGAPSRSCEVVRTMGELIEALTLPEDPPASLRNRDELLAGRRIGVITNLPVHYRVPLFNELGRRLDSAGAHFRVFFLAPRDPARAWLDGAESLECEHEFLRSERLSSRLRLERRLAAFAPTLLVAGGFSSVAARAALYAASRAIPFGVWSGDLPWSRTAGSRLRRPLRRWILRRATFAVAYGSASAEYLRTLSPSLPVVYARNATPIPDARETAGDSGVAEILAVARAVPGKGLETIVEAFALLENLPCRLTVVGGGPELSTLQRRAEGNGFVRFLGELEPARVRALYGDADVFAFPSRIDVFGLVLVEAMAAGLATVVTAAPGAVADLAVPGRNCLVVKEDRPESWAGALRQLVVDPGLRARLGQVAAATIRRRWTIAHSVDAWVAGLRLGLLEKVL